MLCASSGTSQVIEAIQRAPADSAAGAVKAGIISRRGKEARNIAKVAAARRLLTLVYYGLRDGQIRALPASPAGPPRPSRLRGRHEQLFLASGQARGRLLCCPAALTRQRGRPLD